MPYPPAISIRMQGSLSLTAAAVHDFGLTPGTPVYILRNQRMGTMALKIAHERDKNWNRARRIVVGKTSNGPYYYIVMATNAIHGLRPGVYPFLPPDPGAELFEVDLGNRISVYHDCLGRPAVRSWDNRAFTAQLHVEMECEPTYSWPLPPSVS